MASDVLEGLPGSEMLQLLLVQQVLCGFVVLHGGLSLSSGSFANPHLSPYLWLFCAQVGTREVPERATDSVCHFWGQAEEEAGGEVAWA